ncbi:50S ribosomal protein L24e [Candidatus Pacearchaeota archaeon]|nr:50S ribosomal protein L24e [Candidatus Pacearchaeota archaeon]
MPACSFCKKQYTEPRGLTIFTFDGKSIHYCSSKCKRNAKLKRDPKKTNWVKKDPDYKKKIERSPKKKGKRVLNTKSNKK